MWWTIGMDLDVSGRYDKEFTRRPKMILICRQSSSHVLSPIRKSLAERTGSCGAKGVSMRESPPHERLDL